MLELDGIGLLIYLAVWVGCFIDVLLTPDGQPRNLPKLAWVFIVLFFGIIGSIAWLVAGRPWNRGNTAPMSRGAASREPEYDRPGRRVPANPDDDEVFLAGLRKRAEEQRQRARDQAGPQGTDPSANPEVEKPEA